MQKEKRKTYTFRVPESIHLQMELAAFKESRTVNSWLLNVVIQHLEAQKEKK
jgi:predicted HicB family RNase H-like nuclease